MRIEQRVESLDNQGEIEKGGAKFGSTQKTPTISKRLCAAKPFNKT